VPNQPTDPHGGALVEACPAVADLADLARLLRQLRRRQARERGDSPLTHRELAAKTGWSHGIISAYLTGQVLAPTDRFDVLIRLLGATSAEQSALATARDRVEEARRGGVEDEGARAIARRPPPRQLPAALPYFVGRREELATLDALAERTSGPAATVVIAAVGGLAGIGKSTLALHWAHRAAARFGDGQLYVNMRGFDASEQPATAAEAVRAFLDALGVPPARMPATLEAQAALYRSLLAGRRVLVVVDNVRDAAQVRPLLPGLPGCMVLVTSRSRLVSLVAGDGAEPIVLDVLSAAEGRLLLARRLGEHRVLGDPRAVDEIVDRCARLPLALAVLAARAAAHPQFPLAALAAQLRGAGRGLDGFELGEAATGVRSVFSWSYRQLGGPAARLFRLLASHPGPEVSTTAAASLAAQPVETVGAALAELTRSHMLSEPAPGRYAMHDLLRAYAAELSQQVDADEDLRAATRRMLDHYLHSAFAADRLLAPEREPIVLDAPGAGVAVDDVADHAEALAWFAREHREMLAVTRLAADRGCDRIAAQLAWTLVDYLNWQGHWRDLADVGRVAVAAARRLGDGAAQARAERSLGATYTRLGRYDDARSHIGSALALFRDLGDPIGAAHAHLHLSEVYERQGQHRDALAHAEQTLALARSVGHATWCARALNAVGWYHAQLGEHRLALTHCREALAIQERLDDRDGAADSWDSIGFAHHHLGEHERAVECYRNAVRLWQDTGNRHGQADALANLGHALLALDRAHDARDAWVKALTIFDDLDHPDAKSVRASLERLDPGDGPGVGPPSFPSS
jgi:tetratricopeptide (TPR) repeat protein